jgi:hypothetical protein
MAGQWMAASTERWTTVKHIGLPYYYIIVRDSGAAEAVRLAQVTYAGEFKTLEGSSQFVEIVSAEGEMSQARIILRGRAAGQAQVNISVTGEVKSPEGAYLWSGAGSEPVLITVIP